MGNMTPESHLNEKDDLRIVRRRSGRCASMPHSTPSSPRASLAGGALSLSLAGGALSLSLAGGALSLSLAGGALSLSLAEGVTRPQGRHSCAQRKQRKQRGSVLVAVLAIILVITFMVTRFMNEAVEDLEYRAIFNEPSDVRAFAYGMLEVALATVQEVALIDDGKLYAGEQGWSDPISYAGIIIPNGWSVSISMRDE
ncbi:MAG: hypothetical protein ACJAS5_001158, partial [Lentimonas sp.]